MLKWEVPRLFRESPTVRAQKGREVSDSGEAYGIRSKPLTNAKVRVIGGKEISLCRFVLGFQGRNRAASGAFLFD